jgi:hypothetical protein
MIFCRTLVVINTTAVSWSVRRKAVQETEVDLYLIYKSRRKASPRNSIIGNVQRFIYFPFIDNISLKPKIIRLYLIIPEKYLC